MLDQRGVTVWIAIAVFATAAVFLAAVIVAAVRRWRGQRLGRTYERWLAFLGGLTIGTMLLIGAGVENSLILVVVLGVLMYSAWRRGRRTDAGWLLAGASLPWTALWAIYFWAMVTGLNPFEPFATWQGFLAGLLPLGLATVLTAAGDGAPLRRTVRPTEWLPGSRSIGTVAAAIRGPNQVGPFGVQEIAALVALVAVQLVLGLSLVLAGVPDLVLIAILAVASGVAATEAYVRIVPRPSRLAFEAFSWLGEWEMARVRELTGEGVPVTERSAQSWLARHRDPPETRWIRAEVLLLAGRIEEAITTAEAIPAVTPLEHAGRAATIELARWMAGEDRSLDDLEAAVREVPPDTDDGLRAAVMLAAARTRRRMGDGRTEPGDAAQPLIEVRSRLGPRADGQVGRALRRRILPIFIGVGLGFGVLELVLGSLGLTPLDL